MSDCCLIRDLLPLYEDREVSAETMEVIREHLKDCPDCRDYAAHVRHMIRAMDKPQKEPTREGHYAQVARRVRVRTMKEAAVAAALLLCTGALLRQAVIDRNKLRCE